MTGRPEVETSPTLETLSEEECERLLRSTSVGRLAVADPNDGIVVVPVNYAMDGNVIVIRTDRGTKLELVQRRSVAFEIDFIDYAHRAGWSVLVRGRAYEATHWEIDAVQLTPWLGGEKGHWIRIDPEQITGRRIVVPPAPPASHGYM